MLGNNDGQNPAVPDGFAPKCFKWVVKHVARGGLAGHLSGESSCPLLQGTALVKNPATGSWGGPRSSETIPLPASSEQPLRSLAQVGTWQVYAWIWFHSCQPLSLEGPGSKTRKEYGKR